MTDQIYRCYDCKHEWPRSPSSLWYERCPECDSDIVAVVHVPDNGRQVPVPMPDGSCPVVTFKNYEVYETLLWEAKP